MFVDIEPRWDEEQAGGPHDVVQVSLRLRVELGVVLGQRLKLNTPQGPLLLRIVNDPDPDCSSLGVSKQVSSQLTGSAGEIEIPEVTLGCDPEFFILWRSGRRVSAATYLPFEGEIGSDGELGELRPRHGVHESEVVANLGKLIPNIPGKLRRPQWAEGYPEDGRSFRYEAHSYRNSIAAGFHVHLGLPPELLSTKEDFHRPALNHLVQSLDWFCSVPTVPLETNPERRTGGSAYGRPGDFRMKNVTLEYRTPGAFYLRNPSLARGMLGLSLIIAEYFVARVKEASQNFIKLRQLEVEDFRRLLPIPAPGTIRAAITSHSTAPALRAIPSIHRQLQELPNYPAHRGSIEEFLRLVDLGTAPSPDLLANWEKPE